MKRIVFFLVTFVGSFLVGYLLVDFAMVPVLTAYPRLSQMMDCFAYTQEVLVAFIGLGLFLLILQLALGRLSTIYLYLVYSVYFFFLFVVLFTKAPRYHALNLAPFDFLQWGQRGIMEAGLNLVYFIPLGCLYGFKANKWEFCIVSLTTILGVETMQYVFYIGTFAVSDIWLNFFRNAYRLWDLSQIVSDLFKQAGWLV